MIITKAMIMITMKHLYLNEYKDNKYKNSKNDWNGTKCPLLPFYDLFCYLRALSQKIDFIVLYEKIVYHCSSTSLQLRNGFVSKHIVRSEMLSTS